MFRIPEYFNKKIRKLTAQIITKDFETEYELGNFR